MSTVSLETDNGLATQFCSLVCMFLFYFVVHETQKVPLDLMRGMEILMSFDILVIFFSR